MQTKNVLLVATAIAVISDSMLAPFYPEVFARGFHVEDPRWVGYYLAATCLVALIAFPAWASVEKRFGTVPLLVVTQALAGLASIACAFAPNAPSFVALSLTMVAFKASYLLIYPYLMRIHAPESHVDTVGLLTVLVHLGGILGASLGGFLLAYATPRHAFLAMAVGDFVQMLGCLAIRPHVELDAIPTEPAPTEANTRTKPLAMAKLSLVMLLFYFGAFSARPFFAEHWYAVSGSRSEWISGLVYAIPGFISLTCVLVERHTRIRTCPKDWAYIVLGTGAVAFLMQTSSSVPMVLVGRCLFGWSIFHAMVRLDVLAFDLSTKAEYAIDFSRINVFQQVGVLIAWSLAGSIVAIDGPRGTFVLGAVAFIATLLVYVIAFRPTSASLEHESAPRDAESPVSP